MATTSRTEFETIHYATNGQIPTITMNRPEAMNTIVSPMTDELEAAVQAQRDERAISS